MAVRLTRSENGILEDEAMNLGSRLASDGNEKTVADAIKIANCAIGVILMERRLAPDCPSGSDLEQERHFLNNVRRDTQILVENSIRQSAAAFSSMPPGYREMEEARLAKRLKQLAGEEIEQKMQRQGRM